MIDERLEAIHAEIETLLITKRDIQGENIDSGFELWDNKAKIEIINERLAELRAELVDIQNNL